MKNIMKAIFKYKKDSSKIDIDVRKLQLLQKNYILIN